MFPARHIVYILLFNHFLQMVFLKKFYRNDGHVDFSNKWVYVVHAVMYTYVGYKYYLTDLVDREKSEFTKMWIPLDIILTINIFFYKIAYYLFDNDKQTSDDFTPLGDESSSPEKQMEAQFDQN